jgi:hypothetical protein
MPVVTHNDTTLVLTIAGTDFACQLLDPQIVRPNQGSATTRKTACGDTISEPPETGNDGSITGDAVADYSATGITVALEDNLDQVVDVVWTSKVDSGRERVWTGKAKVEPITRTFRSGRLSAHDVNLTLTEETSNVYQDTV